MKRRTNSIVAALSLLPLGQSVLLGFTSVLATEAMLLSTQAIYAQSADTYFNNGNEKSRSGDFLGAIDAYSKAIQINPQDFKSFSNRALAKAQLNDI